MIASHFLKSKLTELGKRAGTYTLCLSVALQPLSVHAQSVVADPNAVSYSVSATAGLGGSASCSPTSVEVGGSSTCTATPDTGYEFAGWVGDFAGSSATVTIVNIIDDVSLVASFAAESITDVGSSPTQVHAMPMGLLLALSRLVALFGFYRAAT